jgi:hypothetical protein
MVENKVGKPSYEQLERDTSRLQEEVELWKRRAYEEAGKISRINLLLECLKLQQSFNRDCFTKEAERTMTNELVSILYPENMKAEGLFVGSEANSAASETIVGAETVIAEDIPQTC